MLNPDDSYPALHLRSHFPGVLFLKYTLSPTLNPGSALSFIFSAVRNLWYPNISWLWTLIVDVGQGIVILNLDCLGIW